jgi:hypothetical protein
VNLLNPWGLAGLAAALPIVAFYFLKLRRRRVPVSSTWLWQRTLQDLRVNAPFQRLRNSLLLVLQLLLVAFAAAALADPVGRAGAPGEHRWALLIDRSASMRMTDVKPSRLDAAKQGARAILASCGPRDEVMVVAFSDRARVMTPFTSDRAEIERAIDAVEAADTPTRAQEAFRIAASAVAPYPHRTVVILSDGRFEPLQGVEQGLDLRFVPVGGGGRNAAITSIEARKPLRNGDPWTIFGQIDYGGPSAAEIPVECHVNGRLKSVKKVELAPGTSQAVVFEFVQPEPELVELRLAAPDDLSVDDRALLAVRPGRTRLLVAGGNTWFIDKAVANLRDADAFRAERFTASAAEGYDVVILDGGAPGPLPEGRYLVFGAPPPWEGLVTGPAVEQPVIVDWDRRHPATRRISFGGIFIKSCPRYTLPLFATPVVEGTDGLPLVFAYERGRTRILTVAFSLLDSDWPLRLSFPLFLSNALDWLRDEGRVQPRPGEALRLRLAEGERSLEVIGPHGRRETLSGEPGQEVVYGDTERAGLYSVRRAKGVELVALNLFDPQESRVDVAQELKLMSGQALAAAALPPVTRSYWRWIAAAALLLLCAEWFVYHRRVGF